MQLGSIHPDEESARRAVAMLIRSGIEPHRVRVVRPSAPRQPEKTSPPPVRSWKTNARDVVGGVGFGIALAFLAIAILAVFRATFFLADPIGSTRTPVTNEISVTPGDEVVLTIPPRL